MEMKQEEKELLIKDLCGRLPYGVKVRCMSVGESMPQVWDLIGMPTAEHCDILVPNERRFSAVPIQDVKPYLRPMSSMTEEELDELLDCENSDFDDKSELVKRAMTAYIKGDKLLSNALFSMQYAKTIDWLNAHHFNYRGLIEKGLALQAPEGMYKFSDNTTRNE